MTNKRAKVTVLLVEDNLADQKLTERAFKKSKKQIELKVVDNGLDAINYLHQLPPFDDKNSSPQPDIILLDINMPGLDGKQTLRRIRNSLDIKYIPVIMLTTSNAERDILDSYKLGANSYVTKPQNMTEFQKFIANLEEFWFEYSQLPSKH
ncbi:MAG: response regulator [Bacteroidales bacterium]|nr:response regulator [Bacteroidales bacterium]